MTKYTIYYHPYSICSLQVLYTLEIAAANTTASERLPEVELHFVDIFNDGQLDEAFLTEVNPKGQVPVLTSQDLQSPIADSLLITKYLTELWPSLDSSQHTDTIKHLLEEVHSLNYFALSFPDRPQVAEKLVSTVEDRLARLDLSSKYREALAYKLSVYVKWLASYMTNRSSTIEEKFKGIQPENTRSNEEKAHRLFAKLESVLYDGPWLFGLDRPTALDAHAVILIGRLKDVGRTAIVPERLLAYADAAFKTPALQRVMGGRRTMVQH